MRALITGAHGFVGGHLQRFLVERGDDVIGIDHQDADLIDRGALHDVVVAAAPEVVYHLAGQADVGGSWRTPVETFRANAEGTLNVLDAARAAGARRVIIVSSADVYGVVRDDELPLDESHPLRPSSPYAASKVAAEYLAVQAWLGTGLETVRVRAFNHLGPGQSPRFVAPAIAERIVIAERSGDDVITVGNLSTRRDFTDVRDVVRAYRLLAEAGEPGEVYNVCSGVDRSMHDLVERLLAMAARPMRTRTDPALARPVDTPVLRGDATRLRAATGWTPSIPIEQTLADLMADVRERVAGA